MNRKFAAFVAAATMSGLAAPIAATTASAAVPTVAFTAYAFGSQISVDGSVTSGPTALSALSCTTSGGRSADASIATAKTPAGTLGAVSTSARTAATSTGKQSTSTAKVSGINLMNGLVRASALSTTTTAAISSSAAFSGSNSANLADLSIAGRAISASTPPNTKIALGEAGKTPFATVVINKQERILAGSQFRAATAALTVIINRPNAYDLPVGARIDIAQSRAYLSKPVVGLVGGKGFATQVNALDGKVTSSPTALLQAPCTGGNGRADVASANIPNLVSTGTTETTSQGSVTSSVRTQTIRATIASPKLLGGKISASAITAETTASQPSGGAVSLKDTSKFVDLKIEGLPAISDSVAPNTTITIPNLGKVTFHKVTKTSKSIEVVMIEVVLGQPIADLPTGSVVQVGYSKTNLA